MIITDYTTLTRIELTDIEAAMLGACLIGNALRLSTITELSTMGAVARLDGGRERIMVYSASQGAGVFASRTALLEQLSVAPEAR